MGVAIAHRQVVIVGMQPVFGAREFQKLRAQKVNPCVRMGFASVTDCPSWKPLLFRCREQRYRRFIGCAKLEPWGVAGRVVCFVARGGL